MVPAVSLPGLLPCSGEFLTFMLLTSEPAGPHLLSSHHPHTIVVGCLGSLYLLSGGQYTIMSAGVWWSPAVGVRVVE